MNRFKFEAFLQEFPFLKEIIGKKDANQIDRISVSRFDKDLLEKTPHYEGATGSLVGINEGQEIYFVLTNGGIIMNAVRNEGSCIHNEAYQDNESWDGETVLEAIDRHNVGDRLAYIVWENYGYEIRDHYSEGGLDFTVYKPAKGISIQQIIEEKKASASEQVKAEAEF